MIISAQVKARGWRARKRAQRRDLARFAPLLALSVVGALVSLTLVLPLATGPVGTMAKLIIAAALAAQGLALVALVTRAHVEAAAMLAALASVVLVAWATAITGGMASPLLVLFALAPIEALLSERIRATGLVFAATLLGLLAAGLFAVHADAAPSLPQPQLVLLTMLCLLYAFSLAARILGAQALKDMRASANRRAIERFHTVTNDVFLMLRRDGSVERAFGALEQVLQCDRHDLARAGLLQRVHVADRPAFLGAIDRVSASGARESLETRLRVGAHDAAQAFIWAAIDLSLMQEPGGEPEICALVRDISLSRQRAADLTLAREKAEASNAAKGRFLATMSHELRTPLNAIIGFADILDEEVFGALGNDQQREYVGLIRESGGHLLQLVNDLLDMSKLDAGHFHIVAEPFQVGAVVSRSTRLLCQQVEKAGLRLAIDVPAGLPEIVADQRAVRQILINLLSNACKFTPAGGTITLRARKDGSQLVLTVTDTGIGIAPHDLGKIGQPFFQANNAYDRNHQGTGLGLSVVKGLCELHEGTFAIASVEGEGTTVTIRLPFAGPQGDASCASTPAHANTVVLAKLQNAQHRPAAEPAGRPDPEPMEHQGRRAHG